MDRSVVHDVHMAINLAHRFIYFVPEAAEEYATFGVSGRGPYFASRAAPLGTVPDEVVLATFYNFSPAAVSAAMPGMWAAAGPDQWQAARFRAASRALERVIGAPGLLAVAEIAEARSILERVVAGLDLAGKPLGAANAGLVFPEDPLAALWQQVTVLREWRGDVHIALLVANDIGPCPCMVLQVGTGRFPLGITQATRQWDETQWAAAITELAGRGWVDAAGTMTAAGTAARERLEDDTDRLCSAMWSPVGEAGATRLAELLGRVHAAMDAAGTYAALA